MFLMAGQKLGAKPEESVVFEDATLGVEAGKNAKMVCVGVDRYKDPERLKGADWVVSDLAIPGALAWPRYRARCGAGRADLPGGLSQCR